MSHDPAAVAQQLEWLSRAMFGERFAPGHHAAAVFSAVESAVAVHGPQMFEGQLHIGSDDFSTYTVASPSTLRYSVPLGEHVPWRDYQLWLTARTYGAKVGWLPIDEVSLALTIVTQAASRAGALIAA